MGDGAKFTNPVTRVSLAPVPSSSWMQHRREKIEMGVARKAPFNPSAPVGLNSSSLHPLLLLRSGQGKGSRVWAPAARTGLSCKLPANAQSQVPPQTY